jgi:hypothetical protein
MGTNVQENGWDKFASWLMKRVLKWIGLKQRMDEVRRCCVVVNGGVVERKLGEVINEVWLLTIDKTPTMLSKVHSAV